MEGSRNFPFSVLSAQRPTWTIQVASRITGTTTREILLPVSPVIYHFIRGETKGGKLDDHEKQRGILRRHLAEISVDGAEGGRRGGGTVCDNGKWDFYRSDDGPHRRGKGQRWRINRGERRTKSFCIIKLGY